MRRTYTIGTEETKIRKSHGQLARHITLLVSRHPATLTYWIMIKRITKFKNRQTCRQAF